MSTKKPAKKAAHVKEPKAPKAKSSEEIQSAIDEQRENPADHGHHDLNAVGPDTDFANKTHPQRTPGHAVTALDGSESAQRDAERRNARRTDKRLVKLVRTPDDDNGNPRKGPLTCEVPEDQVDAFVNGYDPRTSVSYGWTIA